MGRIKALQDGEGPLPPKTAGPMEQSITLLDEPGPHKMNKDPAESQDARTPWDNPVPCGRNQGPAGQIRACRMNWGPQDEPGPQQDEARPAERV